MCHIVQMLTLCLSLQCLDESKAPMMNIRKQECKEWLDDYTECLHRQKQVRIGMHYASAWFWCLMEADYCLRIAEDS